MAKKKINHANKAYKLYQEKGVGAVYDYANKNNIPYAFCSPSACNAEVPSIDDVCLICGQETTVEQIQSKRKMQYNAGGLGQF